MFVFRKARTQLGKTSFLWLFVISLIVFEYCLFRVFALHEVVGFFPTRADQAGYLHASYVLYESILNGGFFANPISHIAHAQTIIFPLQAAVYFLIFGASRLSALSINFIYFAVLQIMLFHTIKGMTNKKLYVFIFLGLLLGTLTPFFHAGGMMDFRIDFMSFCLYGIFVTAVIKSDIFSDRKWTLISAALAVLMIMIRVITATYVGGVAFIMLGYYLLQWLIAKRNGNVSTILIMRLKNLMLFCGINAAILLPVLWLIRKQLFSYYVIGHVVGGEKYIRAHQLGVTNWLSDLLYYPKVVFEHHIGLANLAIIIVMLASIFAYNHFAKSNKLEPQKKPELFSSYSDAFVFLMSCVLVPLTILTMDLSKSPIVGGIVGVPFLWLVMCLFLYFTKGEVWEVPKASKLLATLAVLPFLYGIGNYTLHLTKPGRIAQRDDIKNVTKMYEDIGDYAVSAGWKHISLIADQIEDYLGASVLADVYYERKGLLLTTSNMSYGIFALTKAQAISDLNHADVFITNLGKYSPSPYPYDRQMDQYRFSLRKIAQQKFHVLGDYHFEHSIYRVYVKPASRAAHS